MVIDKNVFYIGCIYPHHVGSDMKEIKEAGFTSIVLSLDELDWWYYQKAQKVIIEEAHKNELKVYLAFNGFGIFSSAIPASVYPMYNPDKMQVYTDGGRTQKACPNDPGFEKWLKGEVETAITTLRPDGIFWDEPAFQWSNKWPDVWACYCVSCREKFKKAFGKEMPKVLTDEIMQFRQESLLRFLNELVKFGKDCGGGTSILCMMPWIRKKEDGSDNKFTVGTQGWCGVTDWEPFVKIPELDVFSTDPYWIHMGDWSYFTDNVKEAVELAHRHKKLCQIWIQNIWIAPGKEPEIKKTILEAVKMGADMIGICSFRSEEGSHVLDFGGNHQLSWQMSLEGLKEI